MRRGEVDEGAAVLRLKGNMTCDNPAMWDPVLYRVKFAPHPRTGRTWCVYPSYDMSHCIVDSLEGITHSCCTTEFASRQAADGPYYFLLHELGLYKPVTVEFARCNVASSVLSKRKLSLVVSRGLVAGWDDPRLLTLAALRRRGVPPAAVAAFCARLGVSASPSALVPLHMLEAVVRAELDACTPRVCAVVQPLAVRIVNLEDALKALAATQEALGVSEERRVTRRADGGVAFSVALHAKNSSLGRRLVALSQELAIEAADFCGADGRSGGDGVGVGAEAGKEGEGLHVGGAVGLVGVPFVLVCDEEVSAREGEGGDRYLVCRLAPRAGGPQVARNVQWVSRGAARRVRIRRFQALLHDDGKGAKAGADEEGIAGIGEEKAKAKAGIGETKTQAGADEEDGGPGDDEWLDRINPHSLLEVEGALVEDLVCDPSQADARQEKPSGGAGLGAVSHEVWQFVRVGYFVRDRAVLAGATPAAVGQGEAGGGGHEEMVFNEVVSLKGRN